MKKKREHFLLRLLGGAGNQTPFTFASFSGKPNVLPLRGFWSATLRVDVFCFLVGHTLDQEIWKKQLMANRKWIMSSDQNPGCVGYVRDEILPNYIGIIISHYKDPAY